MHMVSLYQHSCLNNIHDVVRLQAIAEWMKVQSVTTRENLRNTPYHRKLLHKLKEILAIMR